MGQRPVTGNGESARNGLPDIVVPVIVNVNAGSVKDPAGCCERLRKAFAAVNCRVECRTLSAETIAGHLRVLVREGCAAVGVAGGDGSLSRAANLLSGTNTLLIPLPLGTRNHFARDLGIPLNLEDAVKALAKGRVRAIDVGEVNGRLFLNNASVGVYTRAVRWREWLMAERRFVGKRIATLYVMALMLRRLPRYRLFLRANDGDVNELYVPFLFIGNNRYAEMPWDIMSRQALDTGRLHLVYPDRAHLSAVLRLIFGLFLRPLIRLPDLQTLDVRGVSLHAGRRHLSVALDGELFRMSQPLEFTIRKRSMRVLSPQIDLTAGTST